MGSYTILLLLGLGVALATAKPLESTSQPPQVSSSKAPETTEFSSPALKEDSSSIPPVNEDGIHPSIPEALIKGLAYSLKQHIPRYVPFFPQQDGIESWRQGDMRVIPIVPHERFQYEILNEEQRKMQDEKLTSKSVEAQTEKPNEEVTSEKPVERQMEERPFQVPMTYQIDRQMYDLMTRGQRPKEGEIEEKDSKLTKLQPPQRMSPIPIMDSFVPNYRMEPMFRMESMEQRNQETRQMPQFGGNMREESDEIMVGRPTFQFREMMAPEERGRPMGGNPEFHEMMGQEQNGRPLENREYYDMVESEQEERPMENSEYHDMMSPEQREEQIGGIPEDESMGSEMNQGGEEQMGGMPEMNQGEDMRQEEEGKPELDEDGPEPEMIQDEEQRPQMPQEDESEPEDKKEESEVQETGSDQKPEEQNSEMEEEGDKQEIMNPEVIRDDPQNLFEDDGTNMIETFEEMERGNKNIFYDTPDITRVVE